LSTPIKIHEILVITFQLDDVTNSRVGYSIWTCSKGNYFEGYVDNLSPVLEIYQRESVTTWGTRRSSNNHEKENENVIFVYH